MAERSATNNQISMALAYDLKGGRNVSKGSTELHKAARKGDILAVRAELERGTKTTVTDDEGSSPLHSASACDEESAVQVMFVTLVTSS